MPQNTHVELLDASERLFNFQDGAPVHDDQELTAGALQCARALSWRLNAAGSGRFQARLRRLDKALKDLLATVTLSPEDYPGSARDRRWLRDNAIFLRSTVAKLHEEKSILKRLPHVRWPGRESVPRVIAIAADLLRVSDYRFTEAGFAAYLNAFQQITILDLEELWAMVAAMNLVLLERLCERGWESNDGDEANHLPTCIRSLRDIAKSPWKELLEPLTVFDQMLLQDPAGAYGDMDSESRQVYRKAVVRLARYSPCSEVEIAHRAVMLAREARLHPDPDPRVALRRSHVGYYLVADGRAQLCRLARVRLPWHSRVQDLLRRHPTTFYFSGIAGLIVLLIGAAAWAVGIGSVWFFLLAAAALLLPCSQSAIEIVHYVITTILRPQILPKLDFSEGIPPDCSTMVVVATMLRNESQVRHLVSELEVRYLGNMSSNLHFALLSDLPDSRQPWPEQHPLVELCASLIRGLNEKYEGNGAGTFALFHRRPVYDAAEGVWMGWERKRGKLLDFNKLVLGESDAFPVKAGDVSTLANIRYVLTLDEDTELPRGSAARLVGAMAHPLCQAVIDPRRNVVCDGFGILQPRVGISIQSAAQSRMASIYSGQTGFDIYTCAVSDVYQDLFGEGSFVGKGLYEVRTLHKVLRHRFPRNTLLSHDLIEGAYARVGLASDIEVIDDYPSHYSANVRRKHRWMRGDWQIVEWLFSRVPDESGCKVPNPISGVSRWKILDNLRRSLLEPSIFALLLLGWTVLPGSPLDWTLVAVAILALPPFVQFLFALSRAVVLRSRGALADALSGLATNAASMGLTLTFLAHNALVCGDAIFRTFYRRTISRRGLLEWETAADAELRTRKRAPTDWYLLWSPGLAVVAGSLAYLTGGSNAVFAALPILALWVGSTIVAPWLDKPPASIHNAVPSRRDERFVRRVALRTWRYFSEFSTAEYNWLIPDNVQEEPAKIAPGLSPTNLGFLFNARQVACQFGYLTMPEFVQLTRRTLDSMERLPLYRGHLLNWYDARTLEPRSPRFVSTADSGNLAASLIALQHGALELLAQPLLSAAHANGCADLLDALYDVKALPRKALQRLRGGQQAPEIGELLKSLFESPDSPVGDSDPELDPNARWFAVELARRKERLRTLLHDYLPWLLPQFAGLRAHSTTPLLNAEPSIPFSELPDHIESLIAQLQLATKSGDFSPEQQDGCQDLLERLQQARANTVQLLGELRRVVADAERWVARMDFSFLLSWRRKLLSIGYDVEHESLNAACYDLLASETRLATFVAIAKGDIPPDCWFLLGRSYLLDQGRPLLASWTGTMFEYLMPALWMRSYPNTLLHHSLEGAVRMQRRYAAPRRIPWGISESAYHELDDTGTYQYRAFGVPQLAFQQEEFSRLVVAPYATALALGVDPKAAIANLRRMQKYGWLGGYGFYEAADFAPAEGASRAPRFDLVRSWMAHHHGMSLLAMGNFLHGNPVQRWFHADPRVKATELLLQERRIPQEASARLLRWPTPAAAAPVVLSQDGSAKQLARTS